MDKNLIKCLEFIRKKTAAIFFFQNVQKVQKIFGTKKKTTVQFPPKSEQKTIRHNFFNYREAQPSFPLPRGPLSPGPGSN